MRAFFSSQFIGLQVPHVRWKQAVIALFFLLLVSQIGCVRRRLTVRSNPPGALVYIDDQYIGVTPVSTSYIYYGTRKIHLIKGGYETVTVKQNLLPPWYQYPVIDFFAENVYPFELRDERELNFNLEPQRIVPTEDLVGRGQQLRVQSQQGVVTPLVAPSPFAGPFNTAPAPPGALQQPPSTGVINGPPLP